MNRRRKPLLTAVSLFALLAAVGSGIWGILNYDPHPSQRLADGTVVSLLSVWRGRPPELALGPNWMQTLGRMLPPSTRERLGWGTSHPMLWTGTGPGISLLHRSPAPETIPRF